MFGAEAPAARRAGIDHENSQQDYRLAPPAASLLSFLWGEKFVAHGLEAAKFIPRLFDHGCTVRGTRSDTEMTTAGSFPKRPSQAPVPVLGQSDQGGGGSGDMPGATAN